MKKFVQRLFVKKYCGLFGQMCELKGRDAMKAAILILMLASFPLTVQARAVKLGENSDVFTGMKSVRKKVCTKNKQCITNLCLDGDCVRCNDTDRICPEDKICIAGVCKEKADCVQTSDCKAGYDCVNGACIMCASGDKGCNCGDAEANGYGGCYCSDAKCPDGQYKTPDCTCANCSAETADCCPENSVPNNGSCACVAGFASYEGRCRTIGCPADYPDQYNLMKEEAECILSPNGEVVQTAGGYDLCASCAKGCPAETHCKLAVEGSKRCDECLVCERGYFPYHGKCLKCVNAYCNGTEEASCSNGFNPCDYSLPFPILEKNPNAVICMSSTSTSDSYSWLGIIKDNTYYCEAISVAECNGPQSKDITVDIGADNKGSFSLCVKNTPFDASLCKQKESCEQARQNYKNFIRIDTYVQLSSDRQKIVSIGDSRIECSIPNAETAALATCSHKDLYKKNFTLRFEYDCPDGYWWGQSMAQNGCSPCPTEGVRACYRDVLVCKNGYHEESSYYRCIKD